MIKNSDSGLSD